MYVTLYSFLIIICLLITVAYFTLLDRKVMAAMQRRRGPNVVGFWLKSLVLKNKPKSMYHNAYIFAMNSVKTQIHAFKVDLELSKQFGLIQI